MLYAIIRRIISDITEKTSDNTIGQNTERLRWRMGYVDPQVSIGSQFNLSISTFQPELFFNRTLPRQGW